MTVIGITGPTGAGKTTALGVLSELGGCILDADALYHQLLEEDTMLRAELEGRFGPMTDANGRFDRKQLGAVVFHDRRAMEDLNAITHPYMHQLFQKQLEWAAGKGYSLAAIDAIRLFESGADALCHCTLAIVAPALVRIDRIMAREGITRKYAAARVAAQQPDEFYTSRCDHVLHNDTTNQNEFRDRARALFESILNGAE